MDFRHSIEVSDIALYPLRATGGVSPRMALGTMPTRPALLVRIESADGCFGWGEVWANFPPRANMHKAHVIEDVVAPRLKGMTFTEPGEVGDTLRDALWVYFLHVGQTTVFEHILAGIDMALWDLALRSHGCSFAEFMGIRDATARSYASSINAEDLEETIPKHAAMGQGFFKIKIGFTEHGSRELLERACRLCPPEARIMVDSNQSWTLDQAKAKLASMEDLQIFFAEEALPADAAKSDWEELAKSTSIPLAGGENIYGVDEFLRMADAGLKVLQPDVAKWGGISGALAMLEAVPAGVLVWPHFMGTAVGQIAALSVTAAVGDESVCEIDVNDNTLRSSLCGEAIAIADGRVMLPTAPGLVVPPQAGKLEGAVEIAA